MSTGGLRKGALLRLVKTVRLGLKFMEGEI